MPYRIKEGQEVILVSEARSRQNFAQTTPKSTTFNRTVDFEKAELVASPLEEHNREGIRSSRYSGYPWGFSVVGRWENVGPVVELYAKEVHVLAVGTEKKENLKTAVVKGSGTNQYTLTLKQIDPLHDKAVACTCQGFRFGRKTCKHIKAFNQK